MEKENTEAMLEKMTDWIVSHMDQSELLSIAYDVISRNLTEMGDAEIRAQFSEMFGGE